MGATNRARAGLRGEALFGLALVSLVAALWGMSVFAQAPPSLPTSLNGYAWFGCDSMTVNGNTKVYGVPAVNGVQGFGGHIASNGNILVNGTNTIAGNATPGPGKTVTVNGSQNQVQGSKTSASSTLPCEEVSVSSWASWASVNNSNASLPSTYFSASTRNFTLNGNKICTLASGTYYVNNFTCNGNCKLIAGGPVVVVATGILTLNGNCEVNKDGNPGSLFFIVTTGAAVTLNGGARMDLKVYAPLSAVNLNGTVTGYGNLWGKTFTGNGNVTWSRLKDSAAPSLSITSPANGSTVSQSQPSIAITYSDGTGGSGLNLQSLLVQLDGVAIGNSLTVTSTGATGTAPSVLTDGSHTLTASISDYDGNIASGQSDFTVQSAADHDPPVITVTGIEESGVYAAPVTPSITVTDPNLDASSVTITLDGLAYVSGTTVSAEGTHTLHAAASDTFGNHAEKDVHFAIDTLPPVIGITGVADGATYTSPVSPSVSVTDPHLNPSSVSITLDGQPFISGSTVSAEGQHTLSVSAADTLGHAASAQAGFKIQASDTTPPIITVSGVADGGVYGQAVTPVVSVSDPHLDSSSVHITLNGQAFTSGTQVSANGYYTLAASASDTYGNASHSSVSFRIQTATDTTPPILTISGVADGAFYNHDAAAQVTVTDDHLDSSSVQITLDGHPYTSGSSISTDGSHSLHVSASDTFNNSSQASLSFAIDETPPAIAVSSPADNASVSSNPVTLTGYVSDENPLSLTVNGQAVGSAGQSSFSTPVTLVQGANTISLGATDRAGNTGTLTWRVTLSVFPLAVAIASPAEGSTTREASIDVSGTASADAVSVDVNGKAASLSSGTFTAAGVPLSEGANTLTATAKNASGATATASVQVTRSTQGPVIVITAPSDNVHTTAQSVTVTGAITGTAPLTATLNGSPLTLNVGAFSQSVPIVPGTNLLAIRATDAPGNTAERTITVVQDTGSFTVTGISPASGTAGVSSTSSIEVTFNRSVKAATVTASSFTVTSGQTVSGALVAQDNRVTFLPASAYPASTQVQVALSAGITDLSGTALTPLTSTFTTLGEAQSGLTLALDGIPSLVNLTPVTVTGMTDAGAEVAFARTGVSAPLTVIADAQGAFSADLPLTPDAQNLFTAQASLSGQQSPAVPFSLLHDGQKPYVVAFTPGPDLLVDFNEGVAESSVTSQSVTLSVSGQSASYTSVLELSGTRLRITPGTAIGSSPAVLTVTTGVTDLAGNPLREGFTKAFNGGTSGDAFLVGEAYEDASGLPLPGVSVVLETRTGVSAPHSSSGGQTLLSAQASSGAMGAWALSVPSGEVTVHLTASGYSDAYRTASVDPGKIGAALDARLRPLSSQTQILGASGGAATFGSGDVTLTAQAGAFSQDATLTVTALSGQGLPFPLPPGFAPLAAYRVDSTQTPASALTLSVPAPAGLASGSVPAAIFDAQGIQWMGLSASSDGTKVTLSLPAQAPPFSVVLLRLDQSPSSPPAVQDGHALQGVSATALDSATATLTADPASIPPDGKATATVAITPSGAAPSSLPFTVTFTESLDVREGSTTVTKHFSPYGGDLTAYQDPAASGTLRISFPVSPFPGIDVLTLLTGRIDLSVGPYWQGELGGGIVDSAGGDVDGSGGTHVTIPANATSSPLPVRVFVVASSSLLTAIPQGFAYAGGIELSLGGGTLASPATLSLDASSLAVSVTASDTVLLVKAATVGGVATYLLVDMAFLNGDKLATLSGAGYPSVLSGLPWTTVKEEGRYVFLKATAPIAFATGRVTDSTSPLSNALAGILPGQQSSGGGAANGRAGEPGSRGAGEKSTATTQSSVLSPQSLKTRIAGLAKDGKAPKAAESLVELTGINFVTGADGRYLVAATLGNRQVKAVHLLTADEGTASIALSTANQPVTQDVAIAAAPLTVTSTYPASDAQNVPTGAEITVTFSKLLDPASVTADHFAVTAGGSAISGTLRIVTGGTTVAFTPDATFPGGASVSVTVSSVADRLGRALATPYTFSFTTLLLNPPHLDPGKIEARLPNAQGQICVAGGPGAVEGQATVFIVNASHYAYGTVTITAANDGSFSLCIQGALGDSIELHVPASDGTERIYAFSQYVSDDHQTVGFGPSGGTFTSKNADGTPIATISVPAGAFDEFATISLKSGDVSQCAPTPSGFAASSPVSFQPSAQPKKEIELILPAPADWNLSDTSKQYWLSRTVTWGPETLKSPMIMDTMRPTACAAGGGNCLITNSPPFPGAQLIGLYLILQAPAEWGFIAGTAILDGTTSGWIVSIPGQPFVYDMEEALAGNKWLLPVSPGGQYTVEFRNTQTGDILLTETRTDHPAPGSIQDVGVSSDVKTRPYLTEASPFFAKPVQLSAQLGQDSSNAAVSFYTEFFSLADLRIKAAPGTTPLRDPSVPNPWGTPNQRVQVTITPPSDPPSPLPPLTAYVAVQPDGAIDFHLRDLRDASGGAVDALSYINSGWGVKVTYPTFAGGSTNASTTIASKDLPKNLRLSIQTGKLYLGAGPAFADTNADLLVYNAMQAHPQLLLGEAVLPQATAPAKNQVNLSKSADGLTDYQLRADDVLFLTLAQRNVDTSSPMKVTFDWFVKTPADQNPPEAPNGRVTLVVHDDPDTAQGLPPGLTVPVSLTFDGPGTLTQSITVRPQSSLKPGVTYELRLENLVNAADQQWQGTAVGRFTVYGGGTGIGNVPYPQDGADDGLRDVVRRGAILYTAAANVGLDILDVSDPSQPMRLGPDHDPCAPGATPQCDISAPCHTICTLGRALGVAIAENTLVDGVLHNTVAVVGGGGEGKPGIISIFEADEKDTESSPPQNTPIGTFLGGAQLCNPAGGGDPQGYPSVVRIVPGTPDVSAQHIPPQAFVSVMGAGFQKVDVDQVIRKATDPIMAYKSQFTPQQWPQFPGWIFDISTGIRGLDVLPAAASGQKSYAFAAVYGLGVAAWDVTGIIPTEYSLAPFMRAPLQPWYDHHIHNNPTINDPIDPHPQLNPPFMSPDGAMRLRVYPNYEYTFTDKLGEAHTATTTILLVAGGHAGLLIYEVYPNGGAAPGHLLELRGVVDLRRPGKEYAAAYDVALDTTRKVAYVADFTSGIAVVDMRSPFQRPESVMNLAESYSGSGPLYPTYWPDYYAAGPPAECLNKLDKIGTGDSDGEGDGIDDRILSTIPLCGTDGCLSRSTLVVDSETGLLYVGTIGANAGLKTVGAQQPKIDFLLDGSSAGTYQSPGYLSVAQGDKPRLALWAPGSAGQLDSSSNRRVVQANVKLLDPQFFVQTPAVDSSGNPVADTAWRTVELEQQSKKKSDSRYNFFLQRNNTDTTPPKPTNLVQLAASYDPAAANARTLMVSPLGGALDGAANIPGWQGWGASPECQKPLQGPCATQQETEVHVRYVTFVMRHVGACQGGRTVSPITLPPLAANARWTVKLNGAPANDPQGTGTWAPGVYESPYPKDQVSGHFTVTADGVCASGQPVTLSWAGDIESRTDVTGGGLPLGHPMLKGVDLAMGTFHLVREDLHRPGLNGGLSLVRTFTNGGTEGEQGLGRGWSFNYEVTLNDYSECHVWVASDIAGSSYEFSQPDETTFTPFPGYHGKLESKALAGEGTEGKFYVLTTKQGDQYTFEPAPGQPPAASKFLLKKLADPFGNTTTVAWSQIPNPKDLTQKLDRVSSVTDPAGRTLSFTYADTCTKVTLTTPGTGSKDEITYEKDAAGFLTVARRARDGAALSAETYTYDETGDTLHSNLLTVTDPDGRRTEIAYFSEEGSEDGWTGPSGSHGTYFVSESPKYRHVKQVNEGGLEVTKFRYDLSYEDSNTSPYIVMKAEVVDGLNQTTTYKNGADGQPLTVVDALGRSTKMAWDMANVVKLSETDANGRVTSYQYDTAGDPTNVSVAGFQTARTYDPKWHRLASETTPDGLATSYTIEQANGSVTGKLEQGEGLSRSESYTYDGNGTLKTKTDFLSAQTQYQSYDVLGNAGLVTDSLGNTVTRTFDPFGRKTGEVSSQGRSESWTYDGLDRVVSHTVRDGKGATDALTENWTYSTAGLLLTHTDSAGLSETYTYDDAGRKTSLTQAAGSASYQTTWTYDAAGRIATRTDPDGSIHAMQYDEAGRQTGETADGKTLFTQTLDAVGNVLSRTDHRGVTMTYAYDGLYRRVKETAPSMACASGACQPVRQWSYDPVGRLLSETDALGNVHAITYDGLRRATGESWPLGHSVTRTFDLMDRVLSETKSPEGLSVAKSYDKLGRVLTQTRSLSGTADPVATTVYDDSACTLRVTDPLGHVSLTQLDSLGHPLRVTLDPGGLALSRSFRYDGHGKARTETDPNGNLTTSVWDGLGRKVSETNVGLSATRSWTYDFAGRVLTETDAMEHATAHEYDVLGRETARTLGGVPLSIWAYDDAPGSTHDVTETDGRGNPVIHDQDALGREVSLTDQEGKQALFGYDAAGRKVSATDREGKRQAFEYDALGRLTRTTWLDAGSLSETVAYDDAGHKVTTTDRKGYVHETVSDAAGRKTSETKSGDGKSVTVGRWAYDALDHVASFTDAKGNITAYAYDAAGRKASETAGQGSGAESTTEYAYDGMDHVTKAIDHATGRVKKLLAYDAGYRVISETSGYGTPEVSASTYQYDKNGSRTLQADALNHSTRFEYDGRRRLTGVTDAASQQTSYGYDGNNNRTLMANPLGHQTTWGYTGTNRLQTEQRASAPPVHFSYNGEGDRVGITDGKAQSFVYHPDALGRETAADYPVPAGAPVGTLKQIGRTFDELDRPTSIAQTLTGASGDVTQARAVEYDFLGRVTKETDAKGNVLTLEYDDNGNRTKSTLALAGGQSRVISYAYDARNRLASVTDAAGTTTFAYEVWGARLSRVTRPDGSTEQYTYDGADRLKTKVASNPQNAVIVSYEYAYDAAGRRTAMIEKHGTGAPETTTYGYDDAGRLTNVAYPDGQQAAYTYDAAGNRIRETATQGGATLFDKQYTYDDKEQLTGVTDGIGNTTVAYAYDANGNQVSKAVTKAGTTTTTTFDYTSRDMLGTVTVNGTVAAGFAYDDLGRRVQKSTNTLTEYAVWDGRSLNAELTPGSGGLVFERTYTHGLDLIRETIGGTTVEAYTDALGSAGALAPEGGALASCEHYRYAPFGDFRTDAHPGGDCGGGQNTLTCQAPYTFTGHLYDQESGLYYFGARYYDPETGRFLSQDPVAGDALNPPSLHKYLYAYSDPMNVTDPWGEAPPGVQEDEELIAVNMTPEDRDYFALHRYDNWQDQLSTYAGLTPGLETVQDIVGTLGYDFPIPRRLDPVDQGISATALALPIGGGVLRSIKRGVKVGEHVTEEVIKDTRKLEKLAKEGEKAKQAEHAAYELAKEAELPHKKTNYGEVLKEGGEAEPLVQSGTAARKPSAPRSAPPKAAPNAPKDVKKAAGKGTEASRSNKTYQTYTKTRPEDGSVYSGRTSGSGTPEQNVARRDLRHQKKNAEGFGPAVLDKSSSSPEPIRGREQQLIDAHGGAQSQGGTSGNTIRGISEKNPKLDQYMQKAEKEFNK